MITKEYGVIELDNKLHSLLETVIGRFSIPERAERIVLNCRQTNYYRTRQGLHPIEIQLKRENNRSSWLVVFFASFSYPDDSSTSVEPELYFHLANLWCYQPDIGTTELAHPEVQELLFIWMKALARHLHSNIFDEVQLSLVSAFG